MYIIYVYYVCMVFIICIIYIHILCIYTYVLCIYIYIYCEYIYTHIYICLYSLILEVVMQLCTHTHCIRSSKSNAVLNTHCRADHLWGWMKTLPYLMVASSRKHKILF